MADINLSKAVRSNLSSLQNTASLMAKTSDRLSTGNKVNTALDNPTNFFTASSLNSRAGDLNQLMDSMANGIKTIEAANNGLTAITKNLESMQSTLRQARQDKSFQTQSYELSTTFDTSTVKNLVLSGGSVGTTAVNIALNTADSAGATKSSSTAGSAFSSVTSAFATGAVASHTAASVYAGSEFVGSSGSPATISIDGKTITFDGTSDGTAAIADGTNHKYTLDEAISKINHDLLAGGSSVVASKDANGTKLVLTNGSTPGTASNFAIAATVAGGNGGLGATAITSGNTSTAGADVGAGVSFSIALPGGSAKTISVSRAEVIAAGVDSATTNGVNSVNLAAALNTKLTAAGITSVQAVKSGTAGTSATTDTINLQSTAVGADKTFTLTGITGGVVGNTVNPGSGTHGEVKTIDQLVSSINDNASLTGKIRASNDNGKIRIENLSTSDLSVGGINTTSKKVDGSAGAGTAGTITGNSVRSDLSKQFNDLRDTLDKLADDASFNGINLLRGDNLKITFNETGTSAIDIQSKGGKSVNSTNLQIATSLTAKDLDTDAGIDTFIDQIKGALNSVRSQASAFGSNLSIVQNRQDFTKSMINTLETGAGNLTLADMNQEAANMMALQTRQSLANSTLSMANQADQGVLQLLR